MKLRKSVNRPPDLVGGEEENTQEHFAGELLKSYRGLLLWSMAIAALGLSVAAAFTSRLPGDLAITRWVQGFSTGWLDFVTRAVSWGGEDGKHLWIVGVAGVALLILRREKVAAVAFMALIGVVVFLGPLLKVAIDQPRPSAELVNVMRVYYDPSNSGFPSDHALGSMAIGSALILLMGRLTRFRPSMVLLLRILLGAFILVVGISRIYMGVHWVSQVLGGYLLGALAFYFIFRTVESIAEFLGVKPRPEGAELRQGAQHAAPLQPEKRYIK